MNLAHLPQGMHQPCNHSWKTISLTSFLVNREYIRCFAPTVLVPPPPGCRKQGQIAQKGHPGQRGNYAKGVFCHVLFLFCVCKKCIPPPLGTFAKYSYPPSETLSETGTPPVKGPPPPLREILNSPLWQLRMKQHSTNYD